MTFQYPSSPILSQPENTPDESICSLVTPSKLCQNTPVFCECVQILELPPKKIVDLIFINEGESFTWILTTNFLTIIIYFIIIIKYLLLSIFNVGFGGNISHTFHVHGYNVNIIARHSFGRPVTKQEIISLYWNKKLTYNLLDPPKKDTFVVPNKGYVIVRFYTDNLGMISLYLFSWVHIPNIPNWKF